MVRKMLGPVLAGSLVIAVSAAPQQGPPAPPQTVTVWAPHTVPAEKIDDEMIAKIRTEGMEHSKIMWIEHNLTDVYGPRPIGSPNHKAAADWAVKTMTSWGMKNAHLEPFTWRGVGWLPGRASGYITVAGQSESQIRSDSLDAVDQRHGERRGRADLPPQNPTEEELTAFLTALAPKVKGGIVMVGASATPPVNFNEPQKRIPDEQAKARYLPPDPNAPARGGRGGRGGGGGRGGPARADTRRTDCPRSR